MKGFSLFLGVVGLSMVMSAPNALARNRGDFLDPRYKNLHHPFITDPRRIDAPSKSNISKMLDLQTPVRDQSARGTCSIFSATAALESLLISQKKLDAKTLNLSEEWLEFLVTRNRVTDGSDSPTNFSIFKTFGDVSEEAMPYIGQTWETVNSSSLAQSRCGALTGNTLKSCLLGHRDATLLNTPDATLAKSDPALLAARKAASDFKNQFMSRATSNFSVRTTADIKKSLNDGIPVVLDLDFYYGAWNHRQSTTKGIGREIENYNRGLVGYPEPGSIDREKSQEEPDGHSILVVGYDDNAIITTHVLMKDGTTKTFTYKGAYYFKNSWGTTAFATEANLDGNRMPGYGMITYKYAHEFGGFYRLTLE
ncbi:MAG: C1 family peptidase [Methylotenera sp.]|nr:C1 family peptidase [Oligoflexia bacterium]